MKHPKRFLMSSEFWDLLISKIPKWEREFTFYIPVNVVKELRGCYVEYDDGSIEKLK